MLTNTPRFRVVKRSTDAYEVLLRVNHWRSDPTWEPVKIDSDGSYERRGFGRTYLYKQWAQEAVDTALRRWLSEHGDESLAIVVYEAGIDVVATEPIEVREGVNDET